MKQEHRAMAAEIERKFLVAGNEWRNIAARREHLVDGLLSASPAGLLRVRLYGSHATLTLKSAAQGLIRDEYEYEIPVADAQEMIDRHCNGDILEKTRHFVEYEGFTWHVDEYGGILNGIILAEVEMERPDMHVPLPDWIGREVTGNREFQKIALLRAFKGAA
jgi:adenylate cyclase